MKTTNATPSNVISKRCVHHSTLCTLPKLNAVSNWLGGVRQLCENGFLLQNGSIGDLGLMMLVFFAIVTLVLSLKVSCFTHAIFLCGGRKGNLRERNKENIRNNERNR